MSTSPHAQAFAYRRNPSHSVHHSTFQPQQVGHSHNHSHQQSQLYGISPANVGSTATLPARPQAHYSTSTSVAPFQPAQTQVLADVTEKEEKKSGGFSLASLTKYANIDELKGLVDRFGGLEGILSTVTTVQKVVSTVGQIAPMVKVVTGVLGKNKGGQEEAAASIPARRRVRNTRPAQRTTSRTRTTRSTRASMPAARQQATTRQPVSTGPRRSTPYRPPTGRR